MATDKVMTPKEFRDKMVEASLTKYKVGVAMKIDKENAHAAADGLMCKLLEELGYTDGIKVFYDMDKWYS